MDQTLREDGTNDSLVIGPTSPDLCLVVDKHPHPDLEDELLEQCLLRFYWIRSLPEVRKHPSTSELVDWIAALRRAGVKPEVIKEKLPFLGVLLKREQDIAEVESPHTRRATGW